MNSGRYEKVKARVHSILDEPSHDDRVALSIQLLIAGAIVVNALGIILFTVPSLGIRYRFFLDPLINTCLVIFTLEYLLRIWACTSSATLKGKVLGRLRYALHLYQIIDLISIIPLFLPFLFPRHLFLLRTVRIISIFKLGRYSGYLRSLDLLKRVLFRKREIFGIILFFLVFIILFSSTILYLVEFPVQPDKFSSIPAAMWWSVMTVTTVGYGDIIPVTPLGKVIAALFTILGVLVLAVPSAILASGFIEERSRDQVAGHGAEVAGVKLVKVFEKMHMEGQITDREREEYLSLVALLRSGHRP